MLHSSVNKVGFYRWEESRKAKSTLPWPGESNKWMGWKHCKKIFIEALSAIEKRRAAEMRFKGSSRCRVCGKLNGSSEYQYRGYKWPSGYKHYITNHREVPSKCFVTMIIKAYHERNK